MSVKKTTATAKKGKSKLISPKIVSITKVAKKIPAIKDPMSKNEMVLALSEATTLSKKEIASVLEALTQLISAHIKSRGPGLFAFLGLMKILVVKKPARSARKGVNPFTGEDMMIKAKPAYKAVKIKALKKLKAMVD